MSNGWPGKWHSKPIEQTERVSNDNGLLVVTGETPEEYLWYESDGHDHRTEVRR